MMTRRRAPAALLALPLLACGGGEESPPPGPTASFPPAGASQVIAVIGDSGDTSDLADGPTSAGEVAALVKSWSPDAIATVGDNDYTDGAFAGTNTGLELGIGQYYADYIGDYRGRYGAGSAENRFFPIPGDHDYGDDCDDPRLGDYLDYFTLPVGETDETYYEVRLGDLHIFALDTLVECHQDGGAKLAAQQAWLQRRALASDAPFKVVLAHNPPYSSGARHGSAEYMRWDFAAWGIQLVVSGDDHIYERSEHDGVTYIVNGLGGVEKHPVGPAIEGSLVRYSEEFGALGIAVFPNRMALEFVNVRGESVDRFTLYAPGAPQWPTFDVTDTWQWQLQGTLNTSYDVAVYDLDLFDTDAAVIASLRAAGRKVVCYFSAGSFEDFRADADQFLPADLGATLDGFADERWVDVRSTNVRRVIAARLDVARDKGCDAVEPDNMDGYTNDPGFPLTAADQLDFNRFVAAEAHARGLAVGLKNDLDQIPALVADFDFAVNEQCNEFDECARLDPFIAAGKAVFVAEYLDRYVSDAAARDAMCAAARAEQRRTLVLPLDLDDRLRFSCDP